MTVIALDKASVRRKDKNGFLHIDVSNISKADVNPYFGREIPNFKALGLDAQRVYYLLRCPEELAKAASTFNGLPILDTHIPISAALPAQDEWIGTTGTKGMMDGRYLRNSSTIWRQDAIDEIEAARRKQWSCAYHYRADMTPGEFSGLRYDGVMRDIAGNHLALVETGRAGPDVAVGDSSGEHNMKRIALLTSAATAVLALVAPKLAMDEATGEAKDPVTFDDIFSALSEIEGLALDGDMNAADDDDDKDDDDDDTKAEKAKRRAAKIANVAQDKEPITPPPAVVPPAKEEPKMDKVAMDRAIAEAATQARDNARADAKALRTAERNVFPLVGEVVAMDSAEDVYRFALDEAKVSTEGVDPSAFPALVAMAIKSRDGSTVAVAMDHKGVAASFAERFPNAVPPLRS